MVSGHDDTHGCAPGRPRTRRIPASSVGRIPTGMRPPCVLGLLGLRTAGHERTYDRAHYRANDQSLLPMKLSGVTRTIAIAWASTLFNPKAISAARMPRFA